MDEPGICSWELENPIDHPAPGGSRATRKQVQRRAVLRCRNGVGPTSYEVYSPITIENPPSRTLTSEGLGSALLHAESAPSSHVRAGGRARACEAIFPMTGCWLRSHAGVGFDPPTAVPAFLILMGLGANLRNQFRLLPAGLFSCRGPDRSRSPRITGETARPPRHAMWIFRYVHPHPQVARQFGTSRLFRWALYLSSRLIVMP